jgi:hypothetical protein
MALATLYGLCDEVAQLFRMFVLSPIEGAHLKTSTSSSAVAISPIEYQAKNAASGSNSAQQQALPMTDDEYNQAPECMYWLLLRQLTQVQKLLTLFNKFPRKSATNQSLQVFFECFFDKLRELTTMRELKGNLVFVRQVMLQSASAAAQSQQQQQA